MFFRVRNRVTCVIDTSYAVSIQIERLTRWKPDSPAAAWYCFLFSTKNCLGEPIFRGKDLVFSALPEASRAVHPGRCLVWNRPRNSCY